MKNKKDFNEFLSTIPLECYRNRFVGNKSVEEDLPKNIQILKYIYDQYWVNRNFILFDEFINFVISQIQENLKEYNKKRNGYSIHAESAYLAFLDGWIARQYRTWASILTQIQFGYCAEEYYKKNNVEMNDELDSSGIDVRVSGLFDFGVKKISNRKDIIKMKRLEGQGIIPITYNVPPLDVIKNPKKLNGKFRKPYLDFKNDSRIDILDNGFIIFTNKVFDEFRK